MKKFSDYSEKQFLIILYPNNSISDIAYIDDNTVKSIHGEHCTYWEIGEIDGIEHLTHIAMERIDSGTLLLLYTQM